MASDEGEINVGDVLLVSDRDSRISKHPDKVRPCMVTRLMGSSIRIVGRSATRTDGVAVPATAMAEFDKDGWFPAPPVRISTAVARKCKNLGPLPEPYRSWVLFFMNEEIE